MIARARNPKKGISRISRWITFGFVLASVAAWHSAHGQAAPTITFNGPANGAYVTGANPTYSIALCFPSGAVVTTLQITLNGTDITSQFTSGGTGPACTANQTVESAAVEWLSFGVNTLSVHACDQVGINGQQNCRTSATTVRLTYGQVNPKGSAVSGHINEPVSLQFWVVNLLPHTETFNLSLSCSGSGVSGCSTTPAGKIAVPASASGSVIVNFTAGAANTTGTITLVAADSIQPNATDTGSVNYTAAWIIPEAISTAYTNQEDQDMTRCAVSCFAATTALSTVPYISRDVAHGITLLYNSDQIAMRPVLYADVKISPNPYTLLGLQLSAQYYDRINSAWVHITFLNGDQTLRFASWSDTATHRLAGQFTDSALVTNHGQAVYRLLMQVITTYADHADTLTDSTHHLMVINGRLSPIAQGWSIAGIDIDNWFVGSPVDQSYAMHMPGDGSAALFGPVACFSWGCNWWPVGTGVFSFGHYTNSPSLGQDISDDSTRLESVPGGSGYTIITRPYDTVSIGYDGQNRVISISDGYRMQPAPNNTKHTYWVINYGANGISSIVEPDSAGHPGMGRTTTISVDANGLLRSWTDPDGVVTRFGYDGNNRLDSLSDRKGNLTTLAYDPNSWKLTLITSPAVPIDNNGTGSPTSQTIADKLTPWQTIGVPTASTSGTPATAVSVSNVIAADSTPAGKTTFTVDRWGQPLTLTDPIGKVTTFTYDYNGMPSTVTHPSGATDRFFYNGGPYLVASTPAGLSETDYEYGFYGQVTKISGTGQPTQNFYVSANGHTDSASVNGSTWRFYGDALGRDTMAVDAVHDTTKYAYDTQTGNLRQMLAWQSNRSTTKTFDGHGRDRTITVSMPNGEAIVTTTAYDSLNRVISSTDGLHSIPTRFVHDSLFSTGITDPKGQPYHWTNNALGWTLTETDTANRTVSATYSSLGLPTTSTNRRLQHIQTLYDSYGRPQSVTRPATESNNVDSFRYDTLGDIAVDSNAVAKDVIYSSLTTGLVDSAITTFFPNGHHFKRTYTHDTQGRVTNVAITTTATGIDFYSRKKIYDAQTGLIDSLELGGVSNALTFGYDSLARLTTTTYPSGVQRFDAYWNTGALRSTSWSGLPLERGYGYDSTGRVAEVDYNTMNKNSQFSIYTYDVLGELIENDLYQWKDTITVCPGNQFNNGYGCRVGGAGKDTLLNAVHYSYDAAGSLDSIKVGSTDTVATIVPGNRLSAWTGMTFVGDSDGNRISTTVGSQTTSYAWGADGRLLSVTRGSTIRTYDYDAAGQVVRRSENGTPDRYYLWDKGQILAILDSTANNRVAEFVYFGGVDQPLARITGPVGSSTIRYYAQDVSGNVIAQFTDSTIDQSLSYDPWGASTISPHSDTSQLRWKGLLYEDGITSLYYMRARWYDPITRRFVSPDPTGLASGVNQYAFAGDDPVNGADPTGLCYFTYNGVNYIGTPGTVGITGGGMAVQCGSDGIWYAYNGPMLATVQVTAPYNYDFLAASTDATAVSGPPIRYTPAGCPPMPAGIPQPPFGPTIVDNMNYARSIRYQLVPPPSAAFTGLVNTGNAWDYKRFGTVFRRTGDFNYGATGTAMGFSRTLLYIGAAANQLWTNPWEASASGFGDDAVGHGDVAAGIDYAHACH